MKFIVHGETASGNEDSIVIEGESIDDVRDKANAEVGKRMWTSCWSEEIEE